MITLNLYGEPTDFVDSVAKARGFSIILFVQDSWGEEKGIREEKTDSSLSLRGHPF